MGANGADRAAWRDRRDISARSMLVTVLGDTIAPLGGSVWLSDLMELAQVFGYNDRLVRTSMYRLVAEDWVVNERVGRRSRYSLTEFGSGEIADASTRIYRRIAPPWDGLWTLVFTDARADDELRRHLRWHGFAQIGRDVHVMVNADIAGTRALFDRLGLDPQPMVATASFDDANPLGDAAMFRTASGLTDAETAYREFVERYQWTTSLSAEDLAPADAFLLRSLILHDLRRARLVDPDLPVDLLPADWVGDRAIALAGAAYRAVNASAWKFAESATGLTIDPTDPSLARRFADPT